MEDPQTPAIIAAWAAASAAFVGPLFGVAMAHLMARQQDKRTAAAKLFHAIVEHAQNYRHTLLDMNRADEQRHEQLERGKVVADHEEQISPLVQLMQSSLERIDSRYYSAFQEARMIQSQLNADAISLGLLLGSPSRDCVNAIKTLARSIHDFETEEVPDFDAVQAKLVELIENVIEEIKPLHDSLRRADPLSVDT